jgi:hypothetical protein
VSSRKPRRCQATTKAGLPCKAWAVRPAERSLDGAVAGTHPPRCAAHGGAAKQVGAPQNNKNAVKHGFHVQPAPGAIRTIDDAIAHLAHSLIQLAGYIHDHAGEFTVEEMVRLQSVFGQNLSRYIRAQRDHAAGGHDAELQADIDQALQLAGEVLGVNLSHT